MKKYILVGLSTVSISLVGMNKSENTWVLQPKGGYIALHPYLKDDVRNRYNDRTIEKAIHFTLVDRGNTKHPTYQYLKNRMEAVPLNLFTEGKSYTIEKDDSNFTIVSDRVYDENSFVPYNQYWKEYWAKQSSK